MTLVFFLRRVLLMLLLCALSMSSGAQKRALNWYFGNRAAINFDVNGNVSAVNNSMMNSIEGCASISDANGALLFYTDGRNVWNKEHVVMPNGLNIGGNSSSTQSSIIIPKPGDRYIYYIFTTDQLGSTLGLRFSEVDMSLDNGKGSVTNNKSVALQSPVAEKLTAVRSADGVGFWVLTHGITDNRFYAYQITTNGVNTTAVISTAGSTHQQNESIGHMKFSPDGKYVAVVVSTPGRFLELFSFNSATGVVSGNGVIRVDYSSDLNPYGVEFSADVSKLYVSAGRNIFQYSMNMAISENLFHMSETRVQTSAFNYALQLAPNGKIYIATNNSSLAIINDPKNEPNQMNYATGAISFSGFRKSNFGLPNFITSYFIERKILAADTCIGDSTSFEYVMEVPDSLIWDFGEIIGGRAMTSSLFKPKHKYLSPGQYKVTLYVYNDLECDTFQKDITIHTPPQFDLGNDTTICHGAQLMLSPALQQAHYLWQDGRTLPVYMVNKAGKYKVVATKNGCTAADSIYVSVSRPQVKISWNGSTEVCHNNRTQPLDFQSDQSLVQWNWRFNNGQLGGSQQKNPLLPLTNGNLLTTLLVRDEFGCIATDSLTLRIVPPTATSFEVKTDHPNQLVCLSNLVPAKFSLTQMPPNASFKVYTGDGGVYNDSIFEHAYQQVGEFQCYAVVQAGGCVDTFNNTIVVKSGPTVYLDRHLLDSCENTGNVQLTASSSSILQENWLYSGHGDSSNKLSAGFEYLQAGVYYPSVKVKDVDGCIATTSSFVEIFPVPDVKFEHPAGSECIGAAEWKWNNHTSIAKGHINRWLWEFGDGFSSTTKEPSKAYPVEGQYLVRLTATSDKGCSSSATKTVKAMARPVADFSVTGFEHCASKGNLSFLSTSYLQGQGVLHHQWLIGDGAEQLIFNSQNVINIQSFKAGSLPVKLKVSTSQGCESIKDTILEILPSPELAFRVTDPIRCEGADPIFYALSTSYDSLSPIVSELWEAPGHLGSGKQMSFKFTQPGIYPIKLKVKNQAGCEVESIIEAKIESKPIADFLFENVCEGEEMNFTDATTILTGNIIRYSWDFGNGNSQITSNQQTKHLYHEAGKFNVFFEVLTEGNCRSSIVKVVDVFPKPQATFDIIRISSLDEFINYQANAVKPAASNVYTWFLDGQQQGSQSPNTIFTFKDTGSHQITLNVVNSFACKNTEQQTLEVLPSFVVYFPNSFTPNQDGVNDQFGAEAIKHLKAYEMLIYNRWGTVMFQSNSLHNKWDGTFYGSPVPAGAYGYSVKIQDIEGEWHEFKGTVSLLR